MTLTVNGDVDLPANAVAKIQQSSLLGEKFVELAAPGNEEPEGKLRDAPAHPARAHEPQRRGRGAARRPLAGAERRRAGPAADDQPGARRRAAGPRVRGPEHARPSSTPSSAASTRRSRRSTGRWTARTRWPGTLAARTDTIDTALDRHRPRPGRHQPAARPARVDAAEPGPARRRRHPDHQRVRGRHRRRPAAAAADPDPAGRRRARPRRVAGPAAHLPVPGQLVIADGGPELPAGPAHRRVRAVHQHDGDGRTRPHPDPLPVRDRPGDRRPEDLRPAGHRRRQCGQAGTPPGNQAGPAPAGPARRWPGLEPARPRPATSSARCPASTARPAVPGLPDVPGVQQ